MRKVIEPLGVLCFLLISASASLGASGQVDGPGSFLFILITFFLGYCSLVTIAHLIAFAHARNRKHTEF